MKDEFSRHLTPTKIFRDPIHGDIKVTSLELKIINTQTFLRLGEIRQLGLANIVYACASHTRLSHSLGTLESSQKLIDTVGKKIQMDSYSILLTRLCALLHDLAHIPYGHTLEDEGNLFPAEWKDSDRVDYFLGANSEIGKIIINEVNEQCLEDIRSVLTAKNNSEIMNLRYPFIADLVGDTVCADLLDYASRDSYFLFGFQFTPDPRIINYLSIDSEQKRTYLELSDQNGNINRSVLHSLLSLLDARLFIFERVIFQKQKLISSAMIIEAIYDSMIANKLKKEMLYDFMDFSLLDWLKENGTNLSKKLAKQLLARKLYEILVAIEYTKETEIYFRHLQIPKTRYETERDFEKRFSLPEGSIIIYCPKVKTSKKSSKLRVKWKNKLIPLDELPNDYVKEKLSNISQKQINLWRLLVLIDQDLCSSDNLGLLKQGFNKFLDELSQKNFNVKNNGFESGTNREKR
jgi:HD superfamily phosphohydrolase